MVMVSINGKDYYFDGWLKSNLDELKALVNLKWDGLGFICGYEGDGKSWFASQVAYYLDPTYNIDRCVFTGKQFLAAVDDAKPFQAIVFDEAHNAFANTNRYEEVNRIIISKLTMIRKKQLFILIVAPTFFDLRKYLIIHRARFMIHVEAKGRERGYFRFFNRKNKHTLYVLGKKTENMYAIKPNFVARFTKWFPLDEEAYELKKDEATEELDADVSGGNIKQQRDMMIYLYKKQPNLPVEEISPIIGIDGSQFHRIVKRIEVLERRRGIN